MTDRQPSSSAEDGESRSTLWLQLHESPFEGEWVGLTPDWAARLPCDPAELAWVRLWLCLTSPAESALSLRIFEQIGHELELRRHMPSYGDLEG